jgi:hypothetical protein
MRSQWAAEKQPMGDEQERGVDSPLDACTLLQGARRVPVNPKLQTPCPALPRPAPPRPAPPRPAPPRPAPPRPAPPRPTPLRRPTCRPKSAGAAMAASASAARLACSLRSWRTHQRVMTPNNAS